MTAAAIHGRAGLFRTLASDDILSVTDSSRIFFLNAGDTLRQGVELSATYETRKWQVYGSYAFVDATLDTCTDPDDEGHAPSSTRATPAGHPAASLQGRLRILGDVQVEVRRRSRRRERPAVLPQRSRRREHGPALAGYTRVDLHTSYDVTKNIQLYGLVKNLFDQRYGLYGTYFESRRGERASSGSRRPRLQDPRTISPSMPFAAYGGVKVRY